jgi:hypothetical protein
MTRWQFGQECFMLWWLLCACADSWIFVTCELKSFSEWPEDTLDSNASCSDVCSVHALTAEFFLNLWTKVFLPMTWWQFEQQFCMLWWTICACAFSWIFVTYELKSFSRWPDDSLDNNSACSDGRSAHALTAECFYLWTEVFLPMTWWQFGQQCFMLWWTLCTCSNSWWFSGKPLPHNAHLCGCTPSAGCFL